MHGTCYCCCLNLNEYHDKFSYLQEWVCCNIKWWKSGTTYKWRKLCTNNTFSFVNIFNYLTFNFILSRCCIMQSLFDFSLSYTTNCNKICVVVVDFYLQKTTNNFSCRSSTLFFSVFTGNAVSQVLQHKEEPRFISQSEAFKFAVGDTIILPCEVTQPGEWTHKFCLDLLFFPCLFVFRFICCSVCKCNKCLIFMWGQKISRGRNTSDIPHPHFFQFPITKILLWPSTSVFCWSLNGREVFLQISLTMCDFLPILDQKKIKLDFWK